MARSFNGTTNHAEVTLNLSASSVITVSFWFKVTTVYNNTLHSVFEYANPAWTSGGFVFIPFSSANQGLVGFANAAGTAQWIDGFPNPVGTTWAHYLFVYNRAGPTNFVWRNGSPVTLSALTHTAFAYGNFVNSTLNICSRNGGGSLFHDGSIAELAIWNGDQSGHITSAPIATRSNALPQSAVAQVPEPLACSVTPLIYIPWLGFDSPEPDYSGNKHPATLTGTAASRHAPTRTLRMPGA